MGFPALNHVLSTSFLLLGLLPQVSAELRSGPYEPLCPVCTFSGKCATGIWVARALENKSLNQGFLFFSPPHGLECGRVGMSSKITSGEIDFNYHLYVF